MIGASEVSEQPMWLRLVQLYYIYSTNKGSAVCSDWVECSYLYIPGTRTDT